MPELFDSFGGHKLAGGFTLPKKNLDEFLARVHEAAGTAIDPADFTDQLNIDCEIMPEELSMQMRQEIDKLEPFGLGNPEPVLLIKNTRILGVRTVGANGEHLQFPVQCGEQKLSAIAFRLGAHHQKIDPQKPYDIVFNMQINEWNGSRRLQLRVVDLRESA
jgi:single-stranded-DNA-specific exonuclease